jgi:penicillin-binding protein 1A
LYWPWFPPILRRFPAFEDFGGRNNIHEKGLMLRVLLFLLTFLIVMGLAGSAAVLYAFYYYGRDLPEYDQLADYEPPIVSRVYAGDGRLLVEFATENRVFVPIQVIPGRIIKAFIAAEDQNFYTHNGVDLQAIARAVVTNVKYYFEGRRPVGASTITQQVAKNFLLTNELSYKRKAKEAILALRIEQALDKNRILELYLNEIYLGARAYGVAAAALNYFNKSLDELTIAEAAYLAALPKAPNNYHPVRRREEAVARRNWVVQRMLTEGFITHDEAAEAIAEPLEARPRGEVKLAEAEYFAEDVRRELVDLYGESALYEGGLSVRTTLDPRLQEIADRVLREGIIAYDRRHGWRGPHSRTEESLDSENWQSVFAAVERPEGVGEWSLAVVLEVSDNEAKIGIENKSLGRIPYAEVRWARPWQEEQEVGSTPKRVGDVLAVGDVVLVERVETDPDGEAYGEDVYGLRQVPEVDGAIIALDPHTGRIFAMSGGFSYARSEFNRATQAMRQPGSAFKPFVYLAGLDSGFTPATLVLDAPFVIDQGAGQGKWKPANYTKRFYGPTPMRVGIEKSRNLMTVRLAQAVGMRKISEYATRFGIVDHMPQVLAMALGAGETTLMRLTTAYAVLVNGGKKLTPTLIDRVQDRDGRTVFRHDRRDCLECLADGWRGQPAPVLPDNREQIADPASAYQVVGMLEGVVKRGTGRRIAELGRPLAGKTGTTNNNTDTWFIGFSPDLVVGVFIGFDEPQTLGPKDTGSNVAAPVFKAFMREALEKEPIVPFRIPPDIRLVRINAENGLLARPGDKRVYLEAFKPGTVPTREQVLIDGGYNPLTPRSAGSTSRSTGGLY